MAPSDHSFDVLGEAWPAVLDHLAEAVLVLDSQRNLRFINSRARRLLGYEEGHELGSRCRLTTRGVDCEHACPLTFALESRLERVEDFATVYQTRDGSAVPLKVTVVPIRADDGSFVGAVEILRPREPDPGFVLAGRGGPAVALRRRVASVAQSAAHVVIVGEAPACADVARAVHRFSGVAESLFHTWNGSWEHITPWPPGTMFADGAPLESVVDGSAPKGWRVLVGMPRSGETDTAAGLSHERIEIPEAAEFGDDLPLMVGAWVRSLAPNLVIEASALDRLARMAKDLGFGRLQGVLHAAVAAAGDRLEEVHLPEPGYQTAFVDELLSEADPLAALERRLLLEVLERHGWRMQDAAERLGISRVTLWRKIKEHGIERPANGCDR